ncbi:MAG: four helix bundle protein [Pyrinomonadaceae bacterium]|nr:four helix bundle protein [Sphingobacteriaceae bacterium]
MAFKFEKLLAWQKAMDLNDKIYNLAKNTFPKDEQFILSSQIRRASDSVVLNIAEGCTGQSKASFKVFLNYSLRSAIEVVSCLFIAKRRNYIQESAFSYLYNELETLCKIITGLRNSL